MQLWICKCRTKVLGNNYNGLRAVHCCQGMTSTGLVSYLARWDSHATCWRQILKKTCQESRGQYPCILQLTSKYETLSSKMSQQDDKLQAKIDRYNQKIPNDWLATWRNYDHLGPEELRNICHAVVLAVERGSLSLQEAGAILAPLQGHPASNSWPDGEFVALGLLSDDLSLGPSLVPAEEQRYLWTEILGCMARVDARATA